MLNATIANGVLTITVPVNAAPQASKTGKSLVVASSHGNVPTTAMVNGKPVVIGLNAYIRA